MNRNRRHILRVAAEEIQSALGRIEDEYHDEPNEEARGLLSDARDGLVTALGAVMDAMEIEDEAPAVPKRVRKAEEQDPGESGEKRARKKRAPLSGQTDFFDDPITAEQG